MDSSVLAILPNYIFPEHIPLGSLTLLEHIGVIGRSPPLHYPQECTDLLRSAPRLTSAEVHDFGCPDERFLHPLLLELPHVSHFSASGSIEPFNLVNVHIGDLDFTQLTSLELWFPALESDDLFDLPQSVEPLPLPLMTSLSLKFATSDWIASIASVFSFPNITSLTIATEYPCDPHELDPILSLYEPCSTSLRHIGLSSHFLKHEPLDALTRNIPSLRSMTIVDIYWNAPFFEWLETLVIEHPEAEATSTLAAYPNLQRLCLQTNHRAVAIEHRWAWLREQHPSKEPLVTDGRFCWRFMFRSGMQVLQQIVAFRRRQSASAAYYAVNRLECFSLDHDCLYAMREYTPECYSFLVTCWTDGMEGQPFSALDSDTRDLPDTWAYLDAVPRFFRDIGAIDEDDVNPWTRYSSPRLFREYDDDELDLEGSNVSEHRDGGLIDEEVSNNAMLPNDGSTVSSDIVDEPNPNSEGLGRSAGREAEDENSLGPDSDDSIFRGVCSGDGVVLTRDGGDGEEEVYTPDSKGSTYCFLVCAVSILLSFMAFLWYCG